MEHNPVGWFEIYVQDMARARAFYESMLQLKLEQLPMPEIEMWSFPMDMTRTGASGSLVKVNGVASGGNSTVIYFSCADCAIEEARVVPAGGRVQRGKMSIGEYGFVSMVLDTEGNLIGLHSIQ